MPASKNRHSQTSLTSNHARGRVVSAGSGGTPLSRSMLLASVSLLSFMFATSGLHARALNGGSAGGAVSAPNIAADAASQAAQQAAAAAAQTQQSLARAARAVQDMQAVQAAARAAAAAAQVSATAPTVVPNGLGQGGLVPDMTRWSGANEPTPGSDRKGQTEVTIRQTTQQAILNWREFNVGARTTLTFDQQGNRNWVALNRVDASTGPSQILGQIKADGQVYVINQSGIIFGGASQINVGSLIASTANMVDPAKIYSAQVDGSYVPSFTGAGKGGVGATAGKIFVEQGAQIATRAPNSVTTGGGYVMLLGNEVTNAGSISTPKGQVALAAGHDFIIRPGLSTNANQYSTTRGNEIVTGEWTGAPGSAGDWIAGGGKVTNRGLIFAQQGDVTLTGRTIMQDGSLLATTSVNQRGTIHLLNAANDTLGSVTLTANSHAIVVPELDSAETALDSQRDGLIAASNTANDLRTRATFGRFDNLSHLVDRQDQSRIEIVTGGSVTFKAGSYTAAQGGQIAISAKDRIFTENGATLDVSGVRNVALAMQSNNLNVNIQGNELRDAPQNRDGNLLKNENVWIDIRTLTLVPKGTGGYDADRYYTPGGLLEVGGYLGNTRRTIGEWSALGGAITLSANEVVVQNGAILDISGGSLDYAGGYILSTNIVGSDGRRYSIDQAPANLTYANFAGGFRRTHNIQGQEDKRLTEIWTTVFDRGRTSMRWEDGYTVGRDAGALNLSAPTSIFEGTILADIVHGKRQTGARPSGVTDRYKLSQDTAPLQGTLAIGDYSGTLYAISHNTDVKIGKIPGVTANMSSGAGLPSDQVNTTWLDAGLLNKAELGGLKIATDGNFNLESSLVLSPGGVVEVAARQVELDGSISARGGSISLTSFGTAVVRAGVALDTRGLWTNAQLDPTNLRGLAFIDGGSVTLNTSGDLTFEKGSTIDTSSGGAILASGKLKGGKGGDVTLASYDGRDDRGIGSLKLDGDIKAYGFTGGGALTLRTGDLVVIDDKRFDLGTSMPAGKILPIDVVLTEDVIWPAGTPLPKAMTVIERRSVAEGTLLADVNMAGVDSSNPLVTTADIIIAIDGFTESYYLDYATPNGMFFRLFSGEGGTIPKGSRLVTAVIFKAGLVSISGGELALPGRPVDYAAGSVVPVDVKIYAAGERLTQNTVVATPIKFKPLDYLHLSSDVLHSGFSSYSINGLTGVVIGDNAAIRPAQPLSRITEATYGVATGQDPLATLERYVAPVYLGDARAATLTQRPGVDLEFTAGRYDVLNPILTGGWLRVGEGAAIEVDPGHAIRLAGGGQVTVEGRLIARGGTIEVANRAVFDADVGDPGPVSVWIGNNAVLDTAARAHIELDSSGRRYGVVPAGGRITLNSALAAVVLRPGALLDASGTAATIDLASVSSAFGSETMSLDIPSKGGSITIGGALHLDGALRAASGGAGAEGGQLSILLSGESFATSPGMPVPERLAAPRLFTIPQGRRGSGLALDLAPGAADPSLARMRANLSADQVSAGGFDSLVLQGGNGFFFDGNVNLTAGRAITLRNAAIYNTRADGHVVVSAPYLLLDGPQTESPLTDYVLGKSFTGIADLIDVRNGYTVNSASVPYFTLSYSHATLHSRTDIRFLAAEVNESGATPKTQLAAAGDLELIAQQLYPTTGALVEVSAGLLDGSPNTSTLRIRFAGSEAPLLPHSVFGSITFNANIIEQGGIVRAPLGGIILGTLQTSQVNLLRGSITSIGAKGLVVPYGGTVDTVNWSVDGGKPTSVGLTSDGSFSWDPANIFGGQGISLRGQRITGEEGSKLDLSGGGTLTGSGFIAGRGGSVDTLLYPLIASNPSNTYSASSNVLYAIVPGVVTAPVTGGYYSRWISATAGIGEQITIPAGVPGLPAGTYTLLPANYALLPGAFRVELGAKSTFATPAFAVGNGSYLLSGYQSVAGTAIRDVLPTHLVLTPGTSVRTHSQYNEQGYDTYQTAQAAITGVLRPAIAADGKSLRLLPNVLAPDSSTSEPFLTFAGAADFAAADSGYDGTLVLRTEARFDGVSSWLETKRLVVTGADSSTQRTDKILTISAEALNAFAAPQIDINNNFAGGEAGIFVEAGAVLRAAQVQLMTSSPLGGGQIVLGSGAGISTLGRSARLLASSAGTLYGNPASVNGNGALLVVSNGRINLSTPGGVSDSRIVVGDGAFLYGEQTVGFYSDMGVAFEGTPLIAARNLSLSMSSVNIGRSDALAAATGAGLLPAGLNLEQSVLERLLAGNAGTGAPRVETLTLGATQSINFFGSVDLNLVGAVGQPLLDQLVLNSPAIYGAGSGAASLKVDTLVWNGNAVPTDVGNGSIVFVGAKPGMVLSGGAGTGSGSLLLSAREIVLGYPEISQPDKVIDFNRLALGFSNVTLNASERIVSNNRGNLTVYQTPDAAHVGNPDFVYDPKIYAGTGGNLNFVAPLLTGDAGSAITYRAGGAVSLRNPEGIAANTGADGGLGAIVNLVGKTIDVNTAVVLPSGRFTATAAGDITFGAGSTLDLSNRAIRFFDVTRYSWGGAAVLESTHGNIVQAAGGVIDVSAQRNDAGSITFTATDAAAGRLRLDGTLRGAGGEVRDGGSFDIRVQLIGDNAAGLSTDFAALNARLNDAGFFGTRSFALKQGDLTIGNELRARQVNVSVDGGSLMVNGHIDASGTMPGTIRLAARNDLTLGSGAVLDAHGGVLQRDSYGAVIEARNRGHVELTSSNGTLRLQSGATINLASPDGVARGKVDLNAGRTAETSGDIRIEAGGPLNIAGASAIALNAFWAYHLPDGSAIDQALLDVYDASNVAFINAAYSDNSLNATLQGKLAGLSAYGGAFHLRPGVQITSDGRLATTGDIDLSRYRYGPGANRDSSSTSYGAGEPLALVVRAANDLAINGSISDGFRSKEGTPSYFSVQIPQGASSLIEYGFWPNDLDGTSYYYIDWTIQISSDWTVPDNAVYRAIGCGSDPCLTDRNGNSYGIGSTIRAGTVFSSIYLTSDVALPALSYGEVPGVAAQVATSAAAAMLAPGSLSASIRLVAGADLGSADMRGLHGNSSLLGGGNLVLSNPFTDSVTTQPGISVLRTGTGDLDLRAGNDFRQESLYGVYTAGTNTRLSALNETYDGIGYYPDHGGDLRIGAQGNLSSYLAGGGTDLSDSPANWLWRQTGAPGSATPTAWAINFGSYVNSNGRQFLQAFAGFGALGGGNVTIDAGGDAGMLSSGTGDPFSYYQTTGLHVVVGSTGRVTSVQTDRAGQVTGGTLAQTGGGDITMRIGGRLNPGTGYVRENGYAGTVANNRGDINIEAATIGSVPLRYGFNDAPGARPQDPYTASAFRDTAALGGLMLGVGDGAASLRSLSDLVVGGVSGSWQPRTSVDLFAVGGSLVPIDGRAGVSGPGGAFRETMLPPIFRAVAGGSIYYGGTGQSSLTLISSKLGQLELLARESIYGRATGAPARWSVSNADIDRLDSPFKPPVVGEFYYGDDLPPAYVHEGNAEPIRIYAAAGDLDNVMLGTALQTSGTPRVYYRGASKAAHIRAGRDILNFGIDENNRDPVFGLIGHVNESDVSIVSAGRDILYASLQIAGPGTLEVTAGRNLYQADKGSITSIGPLVQGDTRPGASILVQVGAGTAGPNYMGLLAYLDPANLAVYGTPLIAQPGKVARTYEAELQAWLRQRYAAHYAGSTDADARSYFAALAPEQQAIFLRTIYFAELRESGREYTGKIESTRLGSYIRGQKAIDALFPTIDAGGRPITYAGDVTMFSTAVSGTPGSIDYITNNGSVRTQSGGDIQFLVPGGQIVVGVEGVVPGANAGVMTQFGGGIQMYAHGSILLGLSRIMTNFGDDIFGWSEFGDINAGRGAKTTIGYTPPRRNYDDYGNVALIPSVPQAGAGISARSGIPGVVSGDIDLHARRGTIDVGEAGIAGRNINLSALAIINAANITAQGNVTGVPTVQAPSIATALTTSNATAATQQAATPTQGSGNVQPSVIIVEVLGYGGGSDGEPSDEDRRRNQSRRSSNVNYEPNGMVRVLGNGGFTADDTAQLTAAERSTLRSEVSAPSAP